MSEANKIDFSSASWEESSSKARSKTILHGDKKFRLLELPKDLDHPDWCKTGHIGLVLEGKLELEFSETSVAYDVGEGFVISNGEAERHIPKPISDRVVLFLVEEV